MKKTAVILFNLGGPSSLNDVKSFLYRLFSDKYIINLPYIFRIPLAKFISSVRNNKSKNIYKKIGGKSPILENTMLQASSLQDSLKNESNIYKVFVSMRYSKPFVLDIKKDIDDFNPDNIILLPLYPQLSTTTTISYVEDFYSKINNYQTKVVSCYFAHSKFIESCCNLIKDKIENIDNYRILFSAHSIPEKLVKKGDPYQWQIEETVKLIVNRLEIDNLDYVICYQSKVGRLKWISPNTSDEVIRACNDKKSIIMVPVSFVSEHSETLVELDIDYKNLAIENGNDKYYRVSTNGICIEFINALKDIVLSVNDKKIDNNIEYFGMSKSKKCPKEFGECRCKEFLYE